ncbi:MAG: hypothetical protein JWL77_5673 [Chthonomonadaceae bacterium]|nr:hypothetical protein [Chthonomonadaceae bacterium]
MFDVAVEEDVAFGDIAEFLVEGQGVALGFEDQLSIASGAGLVFDTTHNQRADALPAILPQYGDAPDLADAVAFIDQTRRADDLGGGRIDPTGEEVGGGHIVGVQLLFGRNRLFFDENGHADGEDGLALGACQHRRGLVGERCVGWVAHGTLFRCLCGCFLPGNTGCGRNRSSEVESDTRAGSKQMDEVSGGERRREQTATDSRTVVQALDSEDPEIRAEGFNAALRLLFRINGLTQKRQTQEQLDREVALIQLPVAEAMQSDDPWTRSRVGGVMNGLLATLEEVTRKKQRVEKMIAQLREEIEAARRERQGRRVRAFFLLLGALAFFYAQGSHLFMFWWLIFPLGGWAVDRSRSSATIQRLSEAWDPRAVGVLAVVAEERDPSVRHSAQQALVNLLPRVRASDAAYVDAEGMKALISLLREEYDPLRLAILQALEQIGDERAIFMVMDLRDSPHIHRDVRQAAAECLPALENRARMARESATLLRASSALNPADSSSVLLRPASAAPAAADNLLHPAGTRSAAPSAQAETTDPPLFSVKLPSEPVSDDTTLRSGTSLS